MALWGHTSGTESKPNWLSAADKTNTSAKPHGIWMRAGRFGKLRTV